MRQIHIHVHDVNSSLVKVRGPHGQFAPAGGSLSGGQGSAGPGRSPFAEKIEVLKENIRRQIGDMGYGDRDVRGIPVVVEHHKGENRYGVNLPCDYGYFRATNGADDAQVDAMFGPHAFTPDCSDKAYIINGFRKSTGEFDEHKVAVGYDSMDDAMRDYESYYGEGGFKSFFGYPHEVTHDELVTWLHGPTVSKPFIRAGNAI